MPQWPDPGSRKARDAMAASHRAWEAIFPTEVPLPRTSDAPISCVGPFRRSLFNPRGIARLIVDSELSCRATARRVPVGYPANVSSWAGPLFSLAPEADQRRQHNAPVPKVHHKLCIDPDDRDYALEQRRHGRRNALAWAHLEIKAGAGTRLHLCCDLRCR